MVWVNIISRNWVDWFGFIVNWYSMLLEILSLLFIIEVVLVRKVLIIMLLNLLLGWVLVWLVEFSCVVGMLLVYGIIFL